MTKDANRNPNPPSRAAAGSDVGYQLGAQTDDCHRAMVTAGLRGQWDEYTRMEGIIKGLTIAKWIMRKESIPNH